MPWVRLDENFPDHPKMVAVGPLGRDLFVSTLCYCNRHLTDGFIPRAQLPLLANYDDHLLESDATLPGMPEKVTVWQLAEALISVGAWVTVDGGFRVHDYATYQPTRAEIQSERGERAAFGRRRAATAVRNEEGKFTSEKPLHLPSHQPDPYPDPVPNNSRSEEEIVNGKTAVARPEELPESQERERLIRVLALDLRDSRKRTATDIAKASEGLPLGALITASESLSMRRQNRARGRLGSETAYLLATLKRMREEGQYARA